MYALKTIQRKARLSCKSQLVNKRGHTRNPRRVYKKRKITRKPKEIDQTEPLTEANIRIVPKRRASIACKSNMLKMLCNSYDEDDPPAKKQRFVESTECEEIQQPEEPEPIKPDNSFCPNMNDTVESHGTPENVRDFTPPDTPPRLTDTEGVPNSSPISLASDMSAQAPVLLRARDHTNDSEIQNIVANYVQPDPSESNDDKDISDDDSDDDASYEEPRYLISPERPQSDSARRLLVQIQNMERKTQMSISSELRGEDVTPTQDDPMDLSKPEEYVEIRLLSDDDIDSPAYEIHLPEIRKQRQQSSHRKKITPLHVKDLLKESFSQVTCSDEDLIKTSPNTTVSRLEAVSDHMITSTITTGDSPNTDRLSDDYELAKQSDNPVRIAERRTTYVSEHFIRNSPS